MANPHDRILRLIDSRQANLLRQENATVRQLTSVYEQSRRDLLARLSERFELLGPDPDPARIRQLMADRALILAIDEAMADLERNAGGVMAQRLSQISGQAADSILEELNMLARGLDISFRRFAVNELSLIAINPALEQVRGLTAELRGDLINELQRGLASGERLDTISRSLLSNRAVDNSVFRRGRTSAERMARRAIFQAENNSRLIFMQEGRQQVPGLKKQASAALAANTTRTCLAVHGQIREIDQPFDLSEQPRFARQMMAPPFHWGCRTAVTPYHDRFETRSTLTTPAMRQAARAQFEANYG
jgi:hypothetical protein